MSTPGPPFAGGCEVSRRIHSAARRSRPVPVHGFRQLNNGKACAHRSRWAHSRPSCIPGLSWQCKRVLLRTPNKERLAIYFDSPSLIRTPGACMQGALGVELSETVTRGPTTTTLSVAGSSHRFARPRRREMHRGSICAALFPLSYQRGSSTCNVLDLWGRTGAFYVMDRGYLDSRAFTLHSRQFLRHAAKSNDKLERGLADRDRTTGFIAIRRSR